MQLSQRVVLVLITTTKTTPNGPKSKPVLKDFSGSSPLFWPNHLDIKAQTVAVKQIDNVKIKPRNPNIRNLWRVQCLAIGLPQ